MELRNGKLDKIAHSGCMKMKLFCAIIGLLKISILKILHFSKLHINGIIRMAPSTQVELLNGGSIELGKKCSLGKNAEIASVNGMVKIGENVHIGDYCMIICRDSIEIGENTIFGPHVYIYDHDHSVNKKGRVQRNSYVSTPIVIGKDVWIGINTVILKGTIIGDGCIIGAGSVITGTIAPNTKVVQRRETIRIKEDCNHEEL